MRMLKYFAVLLLCPVLGSAADYLTGQAARAVIGQPNFTQLNSGTTNTTFGSLSGIAIGANTLFAADANHLGLAQSNNRVVIFNNLNQILAGPTDEVQQTPGIACPLCVGTASVLLGALDANGNPIQGTSQVAMREPDAVASDGTVLAVADTQNNRVLIWRSLPTINGQPADLELGQADFNTVAHVSVTASSMRNPQGVWIQNHKLFVADTGNNRVLIWNSIPTSNNQPADIVLGQPNFTTAPPINIVTNLTAASNIMLSPTGVSSDGTRLFVADLGYSRVLIWNSIPTSNQQPADLVIGQADMSGAAANDTPHLCAPAGTDINGNLIYPAKCAATLNFPRFVLPDTQGRLYVADTGNDRVLVFSHIPTQNGASADAILGQPDAFSSIVSTSNSNFYSSSNWTPTPTSLAWDGTNLYVADPTDFRILVFTPATSNIGLTGIVNQYSPAIFASGSVTIGGTIQANDNVTVTINGVNYAYKIVANDSLDTVTQNLTKSINAGNGGAGDSNVFAYAVPGPHIVELIAKQPGVVGDNITLATTVSTNAQISATVSGGTLTGGGDASTLAAGSLITINAINGKSLADTTATADTSLSQLPFELGNVQVYVDGFRAPLSFVSQSQIKSQIPWEVGGPVSLSIYVRTKHDDGSVTVTNAIGVPQVAAHPGILFQTGTQPAVATAFHFSSNATGTIQVAGAVQANDAGTVTIGSNTYNYTVQASDTLVSIRDAFVNLINANPNEVVKASPGGVGGGTLIELTAKVSGTAGNGTSLATNVTSASASTGAQLALTATNTVMCCASTALTPITPTSPAVPGEQIILHATGMGSITPDAAQQSIKTGAKYTGDPNNQVVNFVNASTNSASLNIISASLAPGAIGDYQVVVELSSGLTTNPFTQIAISQGLNTSNIVTIPVVAPVPATNQSARIVRKRTLPVYFHGFKR